MGIILSVLAYAFTNVHAISSITNHNHAISNKSFSAPLLKSYAPKIAHINNIEEETEEDKRRMKFHPITLKCPAEPGDGLLEIVKENENGSRYRGRFYIEKRFIVRITLELSMYKKPFEVTKDLYISPALSEKDKEFARNSAKTIDPVREVVCEGNNEDKMKYFSLIKENLEAFRKIRMLRDKKN